MKIYSLLLVFVSTLLTSAYGSCEETGPLGFGDPGFSNEMETDRPDFTEGPQTVSRGHYQLEAGYLFLHDDDKGERTREHVMPQLLARIGLMDDLELRVAWDGYIDSETRLDDGEGASNTSITGFSDLSLGVKHRLYEAGVLTPDISIIMQASVPCGSSDVSSNDTEPEVKLIWARTLSEHWALAGNINFASPVVDEERFFETSSSLTLARSLSDRIGVYVEYFGFFPNSSAPDSSSTHFVNGGFTFAASSTLQFDILLGGGLHREAEDFFSGFGIAFRQ